MYVWTGMWSTFFGIVTGVIGIKASNQPIFELKRIDNQHRSFIQLVNIFISIISIKLNIKASMTVLSSFTGIVIEVLFFIHRINWNGDIRDPERNDRHAVCEISRECYNAIDGKLGGDETCVTNGNSVNTTLDYAILNKR